LVPAPPGWEYKSGKIHMQYGDEELDLDFDGIQR
jgi:hypothetical protein